MVVPCYNEAEILPLFHETLTGVLETIAGLEHEVLYVDDGSTDDTLEVLNELGAEDARVRVYSLSRNFGHQVALTAGLDVAEADTVVQTDCDLQHPPELLPEMVELWRGGHDVVSAVRKGSEGASWLKRFTSRGFYA